MQVSFAPAELSDVHEKVGRHLESLPGPIDSFLEDHVRDSTHYLISVSGTRVGFASIHGGNLVTQFALEPAYRRFGQAAFQALRKLDHVGAAFVPTCDEFYLSHAIDDYRQLAKQAYFFEALPSVGATRDAPQSSTMQSSAMQSSAMQSSAMQWSLKPATAADGAVIRERSADLFGDVDKRIERGELFMTDRAGACVGFGIMARSEFQRSVASIGMFTLEPFRCTGVGSATIALLIQECSRRGMRAVAGCWYYNHASKRTLERAGMITKTRLLRVEY